MTLSSTGFGSDLDPIFLVNCTATWDSPGYLNQTQGCAPIERHRTGYCLLFSLLLSSLNHRRIGITTWSQREIEQDTATACGFVNSNQVC
ncbi:hypothetical protein PGT21_029282 [Puccinia graminis f. sp. tritici]|uniref:Uncharacterized protein n=1 Tax=Puccinia graminis f. sp. tritici TaxID=56615 RepID=A0A5B0NVA7_PUCGR|nr:hypothetical protein PGT21_029282 [Puccinia graminis f. sp. tritici]